MLVNPNMDTLMETLLAFTAGFAAALFYSKGKANPLKSFTIDAKRAGRWARKKVQSR